MITKYLKTAVWTPCITRLADEIKPLLIRKSRGKCSPKLLEGFLLCVLLGGAHWAQTYRQQQEGFPHDRHPVWWLFLIKIIVASNNENFSGSQEFCRQRSLKRISLSSKHSERLFILRRWKCNNFMFMYKRLIFFRFAKEKSEKKVIQWVYQRKLRLKIAFAIVKFWNMKNGSLEKQTWSLTYEENFSVIKMPATIFCCVSFLKWLWRVSLVFLFPSLMNTGCPRPKIP